jgi:cytochrome c oxidase subunit 4
MSNEQNHITDFAGYAKITLALIVLTALNIFIAWLKPVTFTGALILLVCTIQGAIAVTYFMHLRYDKPFLKFIVSGLFLLYALIIIITFLDYKLR